MQQKLIVFAKIFLLSPQLSPLQKKLAFISIEFEIQKQIDTKIFNLYKKVCY